MVYSLLYVSKSLLAPAEAEVELACILNGSCARNAGLDVTGALISVGGHFAQLLEGPQQAVELLMRSIEDDPRHMRVKIVRTAHEPRRFAGWSMVYGGHLNAACRHITPLFAALPPRDTAHLARRLLQMMEEFARLPVS